jgi:Nucleotidyl transferase AbiEii toxin, Type IV TA system
MNQAKAQGVEFQRVLVLYGLERLLYRISVSPFSEEFILKGAILLSLWFDAPYRRTRDIDLLGKDTPSPERFTAVFQDLCELAVEEDGLRFAPETVTVKPIREENESSSPRFWRGHESPSRSISALGMRLCRSPSKSSFQCYYLGSLHRFFVPIRRRPPLQRSSMPWWYWSAATAE